jgi:pyridoxal phosphate-dependent aminotransferase EpsN
LPEKVARRVQIFERYRAGLAAHPELEFMPAAAWGRPSRWLSCLLCASSAQRDALIARLSQANIEARPVWKPLHRQPVFAALERVGGDTAVDLFERGLCLPSGSNLTDADQDRILALLEEALRSREASS